MIGSARLSWLIGSGGVITAATMKTPTMAYLRFSAMPLEEAIPIIVLYEISILMAKLVEKKKAKQDAEVEAEYGGDDTDSSGETDET